MADNTTLLKTPLHSRHVELGARMAPFAGFDMPVQYSGIIDEHMAVRQKAGMFDVSHMGEVRVTGPNAAAFVQRLVTNDITSLYDGKALYTVMCRADGRIVDDLLVYRLDEEDFLLVINASNIESDFAWMKHNNEADADLSNISDEVGLIALQGPAAFQILEKATGFDASGLKYYHFERTRLLGLYNVMVSRTGYTGEAGVELYCDAPDTVAFWDALMVAGTPLGLKPAGLGARDTLRLEAGFCLYGNDITEDTNPLEAGLGWLTKLDAGDFIGRDALVKIKETGPERRLVGFVVSERGIPRAGYDICEPGGSVIGTVTSGSQSPILEQGIGLGYVPNDPRFTQPGSAIAISVRGRMLGAEVRKPPFHVAD